MGIPCFLMVESGLQRVWLRRYAGSNEPCTKGSYHNAMTLVGDFPESKDTEGYVEQIPAETYQGDTRWPARCPCGYEFGKGDIFQVFTRSLYRRTDGGNLPGGAAHVSLEEAPVGAMWNAWWQGEGRRLKAEGRAEFFPGRGVGPDGMSLVVRMPGGHDWGIDGRCSNCDSPCARCAKPYHQCQCRYPEGYKDSHPHQCWVRHGAPPKLTVDKGAPGQSCKAGAGSIIVPGWHGFLRNGILEPC
ncbi:MAG: hypothetical protein ABSE16_01555 [Verrucomicrobiota bacterium]|jgi:hypothetical protein